ncbi:MAG: hypothetical protein HYY11_04410 [Candidatus Methylomirabilis oxyfera]|nr:hypothetical protein [Candidatus Methylomirabilis oxyfera]
MKVRPLIEASPPPALAADELGIHQPSLGFRDRASEFPGGLNPFADDHFQTPACNWKRLFGSLFARPSGLRCLCVQAETQGLGDF